MEDLKVLMRSRLMAAVKRLFGEQVRNGDGGAHRASAVAPPLPALLDSPVFFDAFVDKMMLYAALLLSWNERMNLTAITEPEAVCDKHFADSLQALPLLCAMMEKHGSGEGGLSLIDVGTGAGFPGIILATALPCLSVTLLDSLQKRMTFLEEVVARLELSNVRLLTLRAEEGAHLSEHREKYDVATARAVAALPALLEYTGGYLKEGGCLMAYKGPKLPEEIQEANQALRTLDMAVEKTIHTIVAGEERILGVFRKNTSWDKNPQTLQYPRKQSKIKNNPL